MNPCVSNNTPAPLGAILKSMSPANWRVRKIYAQARQRGYLMAHTDWLIVTDCEVVWNSWCEAMKIPKCIIALERHMIEVHLSLSFAGLRNVNPNALELRLRRIGAEPRLGYHFVGEDGCSFRVRRELLPEVLKILSPYLRVPVARKLGGISGVWVEGQFRSVGENHG